MQIQNILTGNISFLFFTVSKNQVLFCVLLESAMLSGELVSSSPSNYSADSQRDK